MKKHVKLWFAALFCCMVTGASAQLAEGVTSRISFSNENKPIQKGDSVTINVEWDTRLMIKIIFENVYTPTKEELKNGKYTFVVKPEKTTTYYFKSSFKEGAGVGSTLPFKIIVLDENGVEIKEDVTGTSERTPRQDHNFKITYTDKNEPIRKGDSVTINVEWDTRSIAIIIFENVYTPTKKEIKNGKYTFVVQPEKTTTYKIKTINASGVESIASRKITVTDENGVEIKENEACQRGSCENK